MRTSHYATALGLVALFAAPLATAEPAADTAAPPPAATAGETHEYTKNFGDATLRQFAKASQKVAAIRQEFSTKIAETQDQAKAQSLQQEAHEQMISAIESNELDLATYNAIAERLGSDPELEQRVRAMM